MKHVLYTLATALWLAAIPHQATAACVSGVPQGKPDSLYTISDDRNTVTDNRTGLTWLRCMVGQSGSDCTVGTREVKSWGDALAAASEANTTGLHGHNDWRLPNIKELFSLVEQCQAYGSPSINETVFPNTNLGPAWSSTVANREIGIAVANSNKVWAIDFSGLGQSIQRIRYPNLPEDKLAFRLVRGPAPIAPPTPVAGACGSAHNSASTPLLTSAPSADLCSAGTASSITSANSTFTWSCAGTGGGTTANCQAPRGYSVSPSAGANGSISPAGAQVVAYEATPIFTLTADSGYALDSVGGTCGGSLSGSSYTTHAVTEACTVQASFKSAPLPSYAINASASPTAGGSVACTHNPVTQGGSSTCTATANAGYSFSAFSGDCTGATCTLTNVTSIQSVTAHFAPITYAVSTTVSPAEGGRLSCSPNPVAHGSASTCTASAAAGYTFTGFSGACTGMTCSLSNVTGPQSVTASFEPSTYAITASVHANVGGTASCSPATVTHGGSATCTAVHATNYRFNAWEGACAGQGATCTLTNIQAAQASTAVFAYEITVPEGPQTGQPVGVTPPAENNWKIQTASTAPTSNIATPPPSTVELPQGIVTLKLATGDAGSSATVVLTYPEPLPAGTKYYKFGKTLANRTDHWYEFSGAVINGNTITLTLTDGGAGDNDLTANGFIDDPGGPALPKAPPVPGAAQPIPTLSQWVMLLLTGLLGLMAAPALRRGKSPG